MSSSLTVSTAKKFVYTQETPSAEWQIVHNLGTHPIVDIFVDYEGDKHRILPNQVVYNNTSTCTIWFTTPFSGFAVVS